MRFQIDPDVPAMTLMEICGSHTMAIARHGIRQCLPPQVKLISGPGCPVCVTPGGAIDAAMALSMRPDVIICSYGDMLRVPGSAQDTLLKRRGKGGDVRICLSVSDAIRIAQAHPHQQVVFLGVGFETTAPGTAAAILEAEDLGLDNFSVLSLLRKSEPAIRAIVHEPGCAIDGFLCPGHVAAIIGEQGFRFLKEECHRSGVICGFEPEDILYALSQLIDAVSCGRVILENAYARLVRPQGNITAMALMDQVFEPEDALWRGLGVIAQSGMKIKARYAAWDARVKFHLPPFADHEPPGCCCAQVISGKMVPRECPLFRQTCTPQTPVGPCMVSAEGSCAAAWLYDSE